MDYAIVTVRILKLNWQKDMELPSKMSIKNLAPLVLEMLKNYDISTFRDFSVLEFVFNGKKLNGEASLADYMIWDGSILDLELR